MQKKTILGIAALTALVASSGITATAAMNRESNQSVVNEVSEEGLINLCAANYNYVPSKTATLKNRKYYYLDGDELANMSINGHMIHSTSISPKTIYGGACSSDGITTKIRKAIEYMNGAGLDLTKEEVFTSNFSDSYDYNIYIQLYGQSSGDGCEHDANTGIRVVWSYKTINGTRVLENLRVYANNLKGDLGDITDSTWGGRIFEISSDDPTSDDYDSTITVGDIQYGYYTDSLDLDVFSDDYYECGCEEWIYATSIDKIQFGVRNNGTYIYTSDNMNLLGSDEDLFKGVVNNTFYLGQTNYPSDNNYPTITGPTYIVNVDNPLTLNQIKAQLVATDPTEGDITDRIEIIDNNYILANGKIAKGIYSFTARVSDTAGNVTTKDFTILVKDATAPTISVNSKTTGNSACLTDAELRTLFTASDNYDASSDLTYSYDFSSYKTNYKKVGTYTISCTVKDSSDNSITKTTTVKVTDTTKPTISGTNKTTGNSACLSQAELKALFSYSDDTSSTANITLAISNDGYTANYKKPGTYQVTARATDEAGNYSTATVTITVTDTTKPTISATNKTTGNSTCLSQAELKALFTVSDDVSLAANISLVITNDGYTANYKKPGTYQVTAKATDQAGNYSTATVTITVTDTTKPTITTTNKTTGNSTCLSQAELKALFTYSDDVTASSSLVFAIVTDGYTANYRTPGTYQVTASVTDLAGNVSTATVNVTVTDTTNPTITATNKSQSYTKQLTQAELKALFTISDDVSSKENLTLQIVTDNYSSKYSTLGSYTVVARVTDQAGNSSTATATITVIDDVKPVISFNSTIEIDNLSQRTIEDIKKFITVTDAKSEITEYTVTDSNDYATNYMKPGNYQFAVTAKDSANNVASAVLTITVLDKDVPVITWKDDYIILVEEGDPLTAEKILNILISSGQLTDGQALSMDSEYFSNESNPGEYTLTVSTVSGNPVKAKIRVLKAESSTTETPGEDEENKEEDNKDDKELSFYEKYKLYIWIFAGITLVGLLALLLFKRRK